MMPNIEELYYRQAFFAGWSEFFINPFYLAYLGLLNVITKLSQMLSGKSLSIRCGKKSYQELFNVNSYTDLDIDSELSINRGIEDYFYNETLFPFNDNQYNSVLCNQVFEHIFNPDEFLGKIKRVLIHEEKLLFTVTFVWDEYEQPYGYARYSSFGLACIKKK